MKTAYFAGGCFWCITPTFQEMDGVTRVVSGYSGGAEENPVYEDVKYQRTGHRETIAIHYDSAKVSYAQLMDIFLNGVDPYDGGASSLTVGIPIPWLFTMAAKKRKPLPPLRSVLWRQTPDGRYISAWNPLRHFIRRRKNIRTITVRTRRHSVRN